MTGHKHISTSEIITHSSSPPQQQQHALTHLSERSAQTGESKVGEVGSEPREGLREVFVKELEDCGYVDSEEDAHHEHERRPDVRLLDTQSHDLAIRRVLESLDRFGWGAARLGLVALGRAAPLAGLWGRTARLTRRVACRLDRRNTHMSAVGVSVMFTQRRKKI